MLLLLLLLALALALAVDQGGGAEESEEKVVLTEAKEEFLAPLLLDWRCMLECMTSRGDWAGKLGKTNSVILSLQCTSRLLEQR